MDLQHLPDFKGIETRRRILGRSRTPCSTSLTSKGLRQFAVDVVKRKHLAAPP